MKKSIVIVWTLSIFSSFLFAGTGSYDTILASGIKPGIQTGYPFPVSKQFQNGCFAFAVRHVVQYKYRVVLDLIQAEKTIKKPRNELWTHEHITNFLGLYKLRLTWQNDAQTFFTLLVKGEPLIIQYKYPTAKGWVGHFVAVYSFDKTGVFVSDSISGGLIHLTYDQVFDTSRKHTQFAFATVYMD